MRRVTWVDAMPEHGIALTGTPIHLYGSKPALPKRQEVRRRRFGVRK